jgi:hypothetical protein
VVVKTQQKTQQKGKQDPATLLLQLEVEHNAKDTHKHKDDHEHDQLVRHNSTDGQNSVG